MPFGLDYGVLTAFLQVILIDLVLAGDNAVVIGLAAAGLPSQLRARAILIGIIAATVLRICFALITTQLLSLGGGLLIAGGLLLLWVCWKMWRELRGPHGSAEDLDPTADSAATAVAKGKTLGQAVMQIIIADVSMSLDNVLAVAGAAQEHLEALIFGLTLSVLMMGMASALIARLLDRFRWIAYLGLVVILYVALRMIYHGADALNGHTLPAIPFF